MRRRVRLSGKVPVPASRVSDANALLDIGEAARLLSVSETSLRRWTNSGALPCLRVGQRRERRFRRDDLLAFMEQPAAPQLSADRKGGSGGTNVPRDEPVTVTRGNHLCGIYGSDVGCLSLSVPFLLDGLREGSVCVLIGPARTKKRILEALRDIHPRLSSDLKKGKLILSAYQTSARAQWKSVETHLDNAQTLGALSFRVVGDVSGMRSLVSSDELIKYETGFDDRIVARFPVAVLCLYDARIFSGLELLNVLKIHQDTLQYPLARVLA